jgi:hypothetical protein
MEYLILGTLMLEMDRRQTKEILRSGPPHEVNVVLKRHPSWRNPWFFGAMGLNAGAGFLLPKKYRKVFWGTTAVVSAGFVGNNFMIGVRL